MNFQCVGLTVILKPIDSFFICILPAIFKNEQQLLETVVHKIAHAIHFCLGGRGSMHGEKYKKCGRRSVCKIKINLQRLPVPFRNRVTPNRKCFNAQ